MMLMSQIAPGSVTFDAEEQRRMARVRIAERLHVFPADVDRQPYLDILDLLDVWAADERAREAKK